MEGLFQKKENSAIKITKHLLDRSSIKPLPICGLLNAVQNRGTKAIDTRKEGQENLNSTSKPDGAHSIKIGGGISRKPLHLNNKSQAIRTGSKDRADAHLITELADDISSVYRNVKDHKPSYSVNSCTAKGRNQNNIDTYKYTSFDSQTKTTKNYYTSKNRQSKSVIINEFQEYSHIKNAKSLDQGDQNSEGRIPVIIGDFSLDKTIGSGTFGEVSVGTHLPTGERVAIKTLEKSKIRRQEDENRIKREMAILTQLKHENIVQIYEIMETTQNYYIVMEYIQGGELFNLIVRKRRLSDEEASYFFYQLINGLEEIHSKDIAHRDLKPENLIYTEDKVLKIIDFGLSNYCKDAERLITPCGSPCYASPEMILGVNYEGKIIDIWAIGIILFAMVCGYLPFEESSNELLFKSICECNLEYPDYITEKSKDLISLILVTDPDKRIRIREIKQHPFYCQGKKIYLNLNHSPFEDKAADRYNKDYLEHIEKLVVDRFVKVRMSESRGYTSKEITHALESSQFSQILTSYLLISNKVRQNKPFLESLMLKEIQSSELNLMHVNSQNYASSTNEYIYDITNLSIKEEPDLVEQSQLTDKHSISSLENITKVDKTSEVCLNKIHNERKESLLNACHTIHPQENIHITINVSNQVVNCINLPENKNATTEPLIHSNNDGIKANSSAVPVSKSNNIGGNKSKIFESKKSIEATILELQNRKISATKLQIGRSEKEGSSAGKFSGLENGKLNHRRLFLKLSKKNESNSSNPIDKKQLDLSGGKVISNNYKIKIDNNYENSNYINTVTSKGQLNNINFLTHIRKESKNLTASHLKNNKSIDESGYVFNRIAPLNSVDFNSTSTSHVRTLKGNQVNTSNTEANSKKIDIELLKKSRNFKARHIPTPLNSNMKSKPAKFASQLTKKLISHPSALIDTFTTNSLNNSKNKSQTQAAGKIVNIELDNKKTKLNAVYINRYNSHTKSSELLHDHLKEQPKPYFKLNLQSPFIKSNNSLSISELLTNSNKLNYMGKNNDHTEHSSNRKMKAKSNNFDLNLNTFMSNSLLTSTNLARSFAQKNFKTAKKGNLLKKADSLIKKNGNTSSKAISRTKPLKIQSTEAGV